MRKGLRWKVVLILAVLAVALGVSYPITKEIKRGLDLMGGMHLVLQVMTDDAVNQETDQEILRLQDLFKKNSLTYASMARIEPGKLAIHGLNPDRGQGIIKMTALLEWKLVQAGPAPDEVTLLKDLGGAPPDNQEVVAIAPKSRESEGGSFFLLEEVAAVTGSDLRTGRGTLGEW